MRATPHFHTNRLSHLLDKLPLVLGHSNSQQEHVQFVRRASCGLPWLYANLNSSEAVENIQISSVHLQEYSDKLRELVNEEEKKDKWITGIVAFAIAGNDNEQGVTVKARVFFVENGILTEDSATGSAALG